MRTSTMVLVRHVLMAPDANKAVPMDAWIV